MSLFGWLGKSTRYVYDVLWETPLRILYFKGPLLGGYGFWGNKPASFICSELTTVEAHHWDTHLDVCEKIIEEHFHAFHVGASASLYFSVVLFLIWASICRCVLIKR